MTARPAPLPSSKALNIAQEVRRRIVEREWRQGDRIPDEAELAVEFGVARATVNKALQLVAEEGLLDRRRRAGTHVTVNPVRKAVLSIPVVREQVETLGKAYGHRVISQRMRPVPARVALRMRVTAGTPLIHMRTVHMADADPFQAEDRWINPAAVPEVLDVDFRRDSANEWLVRNAPYTHAELTFSAENANKRDALLLDTRPGQALLVLDRTTWNDLGAITHVRLAFHPGYSMSAE